eukprot:7151502-Prymnesium_polylepis.1
MLLPPTSARGEPLTNDPAGGARSNPALLNAAGAAYLDVHASYAAEGGSELATRLQRPGEEVHVTLAVLGYAADTLTYAELGRARCGVGALVRAGRELEGAALQVSRADGTPIGSVTCTISTLQSGVGDVL